MRDLAVAEVAQCLRLHCRGIGAGAQCDPGHYLLAVLHVGNTDHLYVGNVGVCVEKLLHLARIDVLAAPNDHVLDAPDDIGITLLIHHGQVPGMHPAGAVDCFGCLLRVVPVAQHHRVAARAEFTWRTARHHLIALRVNNLDLEMRQHPAHRCGAALERVVGGSLGAGGRGLGHAVAYAHLGHVHARGDLLHHLHRTRRAGHHAGAQRRKVGRGKIGMGKLGDEHRGHA